MTQRPPWRAALLAGAVMCASGPVLSLETVTVNVSGVQDDDRREDIVDRLRTASFSQQALEDETTNGQDILGGAQADYARLVGALYSEGYYGPVVSILVDGREAAGIDPFRPPAAVREITINVEAGQRFRFGEATLAPRPPTAPAGPIVDEFRRGQIARSDAVGAAANAGVAEWREVGHAKADVAGQTIIARHADRRLDVDIQVAPGPRLRFGRLRFAGETGVSQRRLREILGFPEGEVFSPDALRASVARLRRTGVFSSVALREADQPNPDGTLDYTLTLAERLPRRFGVSAEYSTLDGFLIGGFWLHRNLFGGAERLRVDGEISNIAGGNDAFGDKDGTDYSLDVRLTRPGTFNSDTDAFLFGSLSREAEEDYIENQVTFGLGFSRFFSDTLYGEVSAGLRYSNVDDDFGQREFYHVVFPSLLEWDRRNDVGNPSSGYFLRAGLQPYIGVAGSQTGLQSTLDARTYYGFGAEDRLVLAGRLQLGNVVGSTLRQTPPDFLFFSGGGDTVRGHPYQDLGVEEVSETTGGRTFIGLSAEMRGQATDSIGVVGFVDAGYIGPDSIYSTDGEWHSGVGLGVRYNTPIGPLRVDLATPSSGPDGSFNAVELYIGVGQSF